MRHAYQYHAGEGIIHNYIFPLHVKIKVAVQLVNVFPIMLPSVLMGQFALKTDIKCNLAKLSHTEAFLVSLPLKIVLSNKLITADINF